MNWPAWLLVAAGIGCGLIALRVGEAGVERYGRRVTVTEMIPLGLKGDRAMLLGGLAGWCMAICLGAAIWLAM